MKIEKKHNLFYKITNLIDNCYYYGIHSTNKLDDGYMGGGTRLRYAQKKYGIENFIKEIIADYATRKEASDHEKLVVTLDLIKLDECYNIRTGGDNENTFSVSEETRLKISKIRKEIGITPDHQKKLIQGKRKKIQERKDAGLPSLQSQRRISPETGIKISKSKMGHEVSLETREKISKAFKGRKRTESQHQKILEYSRINGGGFLGKAHSDETKKLISEKRKIPCEVENIRYDSLNEAKDLLNISLSVLKKRLLSDEYKEWKFVEKL